MRFEKHVHGFVVFVIILTGIICVYEYFRGQAPRPDARAVSVTYAEPAAAYDVRMVSLDFINGQSYTTLSLKLRPGQPAPERLLVSTRFYVPGGAESRSWTTTAGVKRPRAAGDRVEVTVASECYWCDRPDAPKDGYFADVYVSAQYEGEAFSPDPYKFPAEAAVPVVVQAGRGADR